MAAWLRGARSAAPAIPAAESTLGSHPCVALSSAQVLPGWFTVTSSRNAFAVNGDYPLNFVSRSSVQRPLLTSLPLSWKRSPQVRCRICPFAPPGSTWCVLMIFGLRCSESACRPHPASLPVRVPTVESLPPGSFSFTSRLRLAVRLRLPSSAPIGSFHPIRFCPCWAHSGRERGVRPTKLSGACTHVCGRSRPCERIFGQRIRTAIAGCRPTPENSTASPGETAARAA